MGPKLSHFLLNPFFAHFIQIGSLVNRPGVAGAVLQTPLSFINSLNNSVSHPF